ncbi:MAG: iron hydrogenase, partial [Butyricicoccus sp.]|nr:iron hydrogenase [Butyricicoccus sp.]
AWHSMIYKLFPSETHNISMTLTPMVFTARMIKQEKPNAKIVFVGPCAAKKLEAIRADIRSDVDFVLTYEELQGMFEAKEINFAELEDAVLVNEGSAAGRGFAVSGGVAKAVVDLVKEKHPEVEVKTARAEGLRDCRKLMLMAKAGKYDGFLLEGMACPGGCVAGAGTLLPVDAAQRQVAAYQKVAETTSPEASPHREKAQHLNELYRPVSDPT